MIGNVIAGLIAPTTPPAPQPVDVAQDPEVEKVGEEESKKEELEITDLVKSQKNVEEKQDISNSIELSIKLFCRTFFAELFF